MDIRCKDSKISPKTEEHRNTLRISLLPSTQKLPHRRQEDLLFASMGQKSSALYSQIAHTLDSCLFPLLNDLCKVHLNYAARRCSTVFDKGK
jgi:hypothetical protein